MHIGLWSTPFCCVSWRQIQKSGVDSPVLYNIKSDQLILLGIKKSQMCWILGWANGICYSMTTYHGTKYMRGKFYTWSSHFVKDSRLKAFRHHSTRRCAWGIHAWGIHALGIRLGQGYYQGVISLSGIHHPKNQNNHVAHPQHNKQTHFKHASCESVRGKSFLIF